MNSETKVVEWEDISTFSKRDVDRTPKSFRLVAGNAVLIVTRHIHYPGSWVTYCDQFFSNRDLGNIDRETAMATAIGMLEKELEKSLAVLNNM